MNRGAPTLIALTGEDVDGDPLWVVGFEWPELWRSHPDDEAKERQHLSRFQVDYKRLTGEDIYSDVLRPTSDPPDFVATRRGRRVGVELAQLLLAERAEVAAQFRQLRQRVLATDQNRFRRLLGHVIFVSFGDVADGKPPRTQGEVKAFVDELAHYEPFVIEAQELPDQLDPQFHHRSTYCDFTAARLTDEPDSAFFKLRGFELALGFSSRVTAATAWSVFEELVRRHDAAGVDDLVVTAGGPTKDGLAFPSDAVFAEAVIAAAATRALAVRHIEQIFLHVWPREAVLSLSPGEVGVRRL